MKFLKRFVPVVLAVVLAFGVVTSCYETAYAVGGTGEIPGYSAYDIIYTILQSMGITISVKSPSDSPGQDYLDKQACDLALEAWKAGQLTDEQYQKALDTYEYPLEYDKYAADADTFNDQWDKYWSDITSSVKDGCVTISQEIWEALQKGLSRIKDINANVSGVSTGDYTGLTFEEYAEIVASICGTDVADVPNYAFHKNSMLNAYATSSGLYFFTDQRIVLEEASEYGCFLIDDGYTSFTGICYNDGVYTDGTCYTYDFAGWIIKNGQLVDELAPDVIWPVTDLAVDIVKQVPTWDEAVASGAISLVNEDAGADVISGAIALEDTAVGEDVFPNVITGELDIPIDPPIDTEKDSEKVEDLELDGTVIPGIVSDKAGDITKVFPFCIPFDIVRLIKGMQADKRAPVWHFKYRFKQINYTFEITVDLTDYEKYFKIFRAGIVIFWVITLMFLTIRWSSGVVKD